jgi:hypothetical protein
LGVVVSDLHGQSARAMVKALIAGKAVPEVLSLASNRLRASREDIFEALQAEEITPAHRFVLVEMMQGWGIILLRRIIATRLHGKFAPGNVKTRQPTHAFDRHRPGYNRHNPHADENLRFCHQAGASHAHSPIQAVTQG